MSSKNESVTADAEMLEQTVENNVVFDGKIMRCVCDKVMLSDGTFSFREVVQHKTDGAAVLAVTDEEKVVLVRQFRYPYAEIIYEIAAGKLEKGEPPLLCAGRELQEETGYIAGNIRPALMLYPTPGYVKEHLSVFIATQLTKAVQHTDEGEFLQVVEFPLGTALQMVRDGEIRDGKTVAALLYYAAFCRGKR